MSDNGPINELTDVVDFLTEVVDLFGAAPRRAVSSPVADDGLPPLPKPVGMIEVATSGSWNTFADAYTADQVRQAMREAYEAGRAAGVPSMWVVADDRLPVDGEWVLISDPGNRPEVIQAQWLTGSRTWESHAGWFDEGDIKHWMPLPDIPQPPKAAP